MATLNYPSQTASYAREEVVITRPNWGAIWSGMFSFIAIWAVFGALGAAIFATAATPNTPHAGISVGMTIWGVILSIIAMFVAGRITGQLAGRQNSVRMHAIVMFGLSVTAALVILVLGGNAFGSTNLTGTGQGYIIGLFTDMGWPLFIALFLGWLAAMGGATTAHKEFPRAQTHAVHEHQPSHA